MTIEATVEANVTENLLPEAATEEVDAQPSDLPTDDKPKDDATPVEGDAPKDKPEPSEVDKVKYAMQKRIDKQTAKIADMERLIRESEQKVLKDAPAQSDRPKESDFEQYEDFLKAEGRWERDQEIKAESDKATKAERDANYQKMLDERKSLAETKEIELKKTTPDYDEKVAEVEQTIKLLTDKQKSSVEFQVFRDMLFSSDELPALTYELGKNPDLLDKMLTMNPLQIARQMARLELQIENAPKQQIKPIAAPPNPIKGKGAPRSEDQMSGRELLKRSKLL